MIALVRSEIADPLHDAARGRSVVVHLVSAIVIRWSLAVLVRSEVTSGRAIDVFVTPAGITAH